MNLKRFERKWSNLFQRTAHIISTGEKETPQSGNSPFGPTYLCYVSRCKMTCFTRMEMELENRGIFLVLKWCRCVPGKKKKKGTSILHEIYFTFSFPHMPVYVFMTAGQDINLYGI